MARSLSYPTMSFEQRELLRKRIEISAVLFHKASWGHFHNADEKTVLNSMSQNVFDWIRYLRFLPGNDFADLLSTIGSVKQNVEPFPGSESNPI